MRRNFLKIAATSLLGLLIHPLNSLANNLVGFKKKLKKDESEYNIINPDLTEEQKIIMFEEGTERAGTSELNYEKRPVYPRRYRSFSIGEGLSKIIWYRLS